MLTPQNQNIFVCEDKDKIVKHCLFAVRKTHLVGTIRTSKQLDTKTKVHRKL